MTVYLLNWITGGSPEVGEVKIPEGESDKRIIWSFVFIRSSPTHIIYRLCQARKSLFAPAVVITGSLGWWKTSVNTAVFTRIFLWAKRWWRWKRKWRVWPGHPVVNKRGAKILMVHRYFWLHGQNDDTLDNRAGGNTSFWRIVLCQKTKTK